MMLELMTCFIRVSNAHTVNIADNSLYLNERLVNTLVLLTKRGTLNLQILYTAILEK